MPAIHDDVFDNGLSYLANAENLVILSADPGLTWANIASYLLGTKASPTINSPSDRGAGGREVIVDAITDGSVSGTGSAAFFALTDDSASKILVSGPLNSVQSVTNGNTFTLTSFSVGIPDPA